MALKDVLVPAGTKLAKATAKGQASGFIATGNEAYMLGGFYMKDPKPKPGKLDKLKKKAKDAVMSKLGKAPKPKEPDPLEEASKSAFGGKRILLPVCNDAESGRCLTLSGGSTESKVQLFSTEMAASLESMDAAGAERFSGGHGVLTPFFALASLMWTKGAAAAAMAKKYASRRSDSVGNTDATTGNAIEMTPMTTRETANREEMTATTEEAVAATLEE